MTSSKKVLDQDLTESMRAHLTSRFPAEIVVNLSADDLEVIFDCLLNVHTALIRDLGKSDLSEIERDKVYKFAYKTEVTYAKLMDDLKLRRNERDDLN